LAIGFASATAGGSPPAAVAVAGARKVVGGGDSKATVRGRAGERISKTFMPRQIAGDRKIKPKPEKEHHTSREIY
jgi:hypothetical protein